MNKFLVLTNPGKAGAKECQTKIEALLKSKGCSTQCFDLAKDADQVFPEDADCAIVIGGDGTMLQAARDLANTKMPILGINLGMLGYLAEVSLSDAEAAIDKVLAGEYEVESRLMLHGLAYKDGKGAEDVYALNDIVMSRCGSLRIMCFDVYVNNRFLNSFSCDGIIVATPTGSTGYNLSAGGPIVEPGSSILILTPICSHALNARSVVLSAEDVIKIVIPMGKNGESQKVEVTFDGTHNIELATGDSVVVGKSTKTTEIIKISSESFLEMLGRKMQ